MEQPVFFVSHVKPLPLSNGTTLDHSTHFPKLILLSHMVSPHYFFFFSPPMAESHCKGGLMHFGAKGEN